MTVKRFLSCSLGLSGDRSYRKAELLAQKSRSRGCGCPTADLPPVWNTIPPEAQAAVLVRVPSLEVRIADLEAANPDLRCRLARVEHQIQSIRQRGKRPSHRRDKPLCLSIGRSPVGSPRGLPLLLVLFGKRYAIKTGLFTPCGLLAVISQSSLGVMILTIDWSPQPAAGG
jgi:hypothetical protein